MSKLVSLVVVQKVKNGVILRVDPNWFAVVPALIIQKDQVDELFDLIEKSLKEALTQV